MKTKKLEGQENSKIYKETKPEKDVLREPGQISFKDALKKAVSKKLPKKAK